MAREDEFKAFEKFMRAGEPAEPTGVARRFTADEMVACAKCRRANAPTRMNCLYCGETLPVTERNAELRRPALKELEEWERGFNVVMLPRGELPREAVAGAAALVRLDAEKLAEIVASCRAIPLARVASTEEAELVVRRLAGLGIESEIFADEILERQPERVRALALNDDALVCWSSLDAEPRRVAWSEITLLAVGRIVTRRIEVEQRQAKLGGQTRVVDTRELSTDESALDIHTSRDGEAFRVLAGGFDYSCLGAGKRLLARENFDALVAALRSRATRAASDDEYARLRGLLSSAWPPDEHTGSSGLRRERTGRMNTEAVTVVSNETQFTRYSRLRGRLAARGRAKDR